MTENDYIEIDLTPSPKAKDFIGSFWQVALILAVNLLIANLLPHGLWICIFSTFRFMTGKYTAQGWIPISIYILCILRVLCLPILYTCLMKKSKDKFILSILHNLKCNNKFKLWTFVIVESPVLLFLAGNIFFTGEWQLFFDLIVEYFKILLVSLIMFDLGGSYLFLYFYWWVEDIVKTFKQ